MMLLSSAGYDLAHMLNACVLVLSFLLLSQRLLTGVLIAYSAQAFVLAATAACQAYIQDSPHLYVTAGIALLLKAILIPLALYRFIKHFKIRREVETVFGAGFTLMAGVGLVGLSILLVFPVTAADSALTRESLAVALSVILLGYLMLITRYNAISMVVGFMSLENGLVLAAIGVKGMPLVVELLIASSVMVAFIIFGVFFFRIRERLETLDVRQLEQFRGEHQE